MRIVVYGGSFNPPHLGHVRAARAAAEALRPDRFFLVPDCQPPHKALPSGSPAPEERLRLTELAAAGIPGAETLDIELRRGGVSYTADTLRALRERFPDAELWLLMGTDMLLSLESWYEPATVLRLASIGVFARAAGEETALRRKAEELGRTYGARIRLLPVEPFAVSSTQLREALAQRGGRELLPDAVYEEIIRLRLYGAKPELAWLRERAYAWLKPKRVAHVRGTEEEAVRLARRWGADEGDAAEAAILHDITKKLSRNEQLQLCEEYGIITDTLENANEKLLHARTGAALAEKLFGVPPEIESAIRWHTTAHEDMTLLEKIVYLADYIEPSRSGFAGLDELRRAAYEDLDAAMLLGLRMSLAEVRGKGTEPHPSSVRAEEYFARLTGHYA